MYLCCQSSLYLLAQCKCSGSNFQDSMFETCYIYLGTRSGFRSEPPVRQPLRCLNFARIRDTLDHFDDFFKAPEHHHLLRTRQPEHRWIKTWQNPRCNAKTERRAAPPLIGASPTTFGIPDRASRTPRIVNIANCSLHYEARLTPSIRLR